MSKSRTWLQSIVMDGCLLGALATVNLILMPYVLRSVSYANFDPILQPEYYQAQQERYVFVAISGTISGWLTLKVLAFYNSNKFPE